jgi:hypothetical protein
VAFWKGGRPSPLGPPGPDSRPGGSFVARPGGPWPPALGRPARLAEQRRRLPPSAWERLFENRWTAAEDRLAHAEDVADCAVLDGPLAPQAGTRYAVGLDVGLTHDRTVAVVCHLEDRAGVCDSPATQRVVLDRLAVWAGSPGSPAELAVVEEWVAQAATSFNRARVVCDPWQAVGMAQRLRRRGNAVEEFTFSSASVGRLAATLHQLLANRALVLPHDPELLEELAHVRLRESAPGVLRMDHDPDGHDDRAVALPLAAHHLLNAPPRRRSRLIV